MCSKRILGRRNSTRGDLTVRQIEAQTTGNRSEFRGPWVDVLFRAVSVLRRVIAMWTRYAIGSAGMRVHRNMRPRERRKVKQNHLAVLNLREPHLYFAMPSISKGGNQILPPAVLLKMLGLGLDYKGMSGRPERSTSRFLQQLES